MRFPEDEIERSHKAILALTGEVERLKSALTICETTSANRLDLLRRCDEINAQMSYIAGIVERGEGKPISGDETIPSAVLRYVKSLEARLREVVEALRTMDALIPAVMDALESDADLNSRRAAFESIQEAYEADHPWGAALAAAQPGPTAEEEP